jgi:hypothetical protein
MEIYTAILSTNSHKPKNKASGLLKNEKMINYS